MSVELRSLFHFIYTRSVCLFPFYLSIFLFGGGRGKKRRRGRRWGEREGRWEVMGNKRKREGEGERERDDGESQREGREGRGREKVE